MQAEILLQRTDQLGEGMLCLPNADMIAWVDILGQKLMLAASDGSNLRCHKFESTIGAVLPASDGRLVLLLRNEVVYFDPITEVQTAIWSADTHEPYHNRFNDGAVDPEGNLWICSMDFDASAKTGAVYRISPDGRAEVIDRGYACLNGPAFSPDGSVAYVGDTMEGRIMAYDIDQTSGSVSASRTFLQLGPFDGLPDGMTVDCDGNLWVCQVTAGRICRYNPAGAKTDSVALPVPMVTSCAFGGPDLSELYVTTGRIILDGADLGAYPDSGSLFRIRTSAKGIAPYRFGKTGSDVS